MSEKKFMSYGDAETIFTGYANEIKNKADFKDIVRPNLLKNWDFENPLNTKGQTAYSGSSSGSETIDGWYFVCGLDDAALTVGDDKITMAHGTYTSGSYAMFVQQYLGEELTESIVGKTVTVTFLLDNNILATNTCTAPESGSRQSISFSYGDKTANMTLFNDAGNYRFWVRLDTLDEISIGVIASKLEIGEGQTLCHDEDGTWVLNEVCDYSNDIKFVDWESNGVLGAKNLFNASKYDGTDDVGITTTKNTDGSITINGTATDLYFFPNDNGSILLDFYGLTEGKKYYFSTGVDNSNIRLQLYKKATSTDAWSLASQVNSGKDLLVDLTESFYDIWLRIYIPNGTTISDVTLYPMVRLASDTDTTYQPYSMTNRELTDEVAGKQATLTAGDHITISNNEISASYDAMTGATSSTAGASGLVPAPSAGQQDYVLTGGGVWAAQSGGVAQAIIGGSYNASTAYEPGDRFSYNGVRYKVIIESGTVQGQTPPNATYYEVCSVDDDIITLNNSLMVFETMTGYTAGTNITISGGGVYKYGKMIFVNLLITTTKAFSTSHATILLYGLPPRADNGSDTCLFMTTISGTDPASIYTGRISGVPATSLYMNGVYSLTSGQGIIVWGSYILGS